MLPSCLVWCSTGVSPLLRGVEIGLAHGFLLVGPFIKYGPLRNVEVSCVGWVGGLLRGGLRCCSVVAPAQHQRYAALLCLGRTIMSLLAQPDALKAVLVC